MRHWSTGNMSLAWLNVELVAPLVLGSGCLITRCYSPILGHTALMHFFPISPRRLLAMTHARPCRLTEPRITIHPNFAPPRCTGFSRADLLGASCLRLSYWVRRYLSFDDGLLRLRSRAPAPIQHLLVTPAFGHADVIKRKHLRSLCQTRWVLPGGSPLFPNSLRHPHPWARAYFVDAPRSVSFLS